MNKYFHPVAGVKPGEIIVSSGVCGIVDQLAWVTCNEGDGVLIGRPVYYGFGFGAYKTGPPPWDLCQLMRV